MKTYKINLIRHATTQGNIEGRYVGSTDMPLAQIGIDKLLQNVEDNVYSNVKAIYCSPLTRCKQTAEIIYGDRQLNIVNDLRECHFGDFEGKSIDELKDDELYIQWLKSAGTVSPPGGESSAEFGARVLTAFDYIVMDLLSTGTTESAIVAHGGTIMTIMAAYALPRRNPVEWSCGNGKGFLLRVTPSIYLKEKLVEFVSTIPLYDDIYEDGFKKEMLKYTNNTGD